MTSVLTDIINNPQTIHELPYSVIPGLLIQLSAVQNQLATRLVEHAYEKVGLDKHPANRLLTAKQAAEKLSVSLDWVYRHGAKLPFAVRVGQRAVRFSERGISRWIQSKYRSKN